MNFYFFLESQREEGLVFSFPKGRLVEVKNPGTQLIVNKLESR